MVNLTPIYILISIISLLIIFVLVFFVKKKQKPKKLSALASLSFVFVIIGMFFGGDDRLIGYGLMGFGIILAIIDIIMKSKKK